PAQGPLDRAHVGGAESGPRSELAQRDALPATKLPDPVARTERVGIDRLRLGGDLLAGEAEDLPHTCGVQALDLEQVANTKEPVESGLGEHAVPGCCAHGGDQTLPFPGA